MLRIAHLELRRFRSYEHLRLEGLGNLTVLEGPNAIGKSNVIEAVQLVTALTSFRHPTAQQLILDGEGAATVKALAADENRQLELVLSLGEGQKRYRLNGKAKRAGDLRGLLPAVAFTPDDLNLVKGSQGARRAAIDALGAQLNPNYRTVAHDFEKVLKHKNRLLKEEAPPSLIDATNEIYVKVGGELTSYRSALFARLFPHMERLYADISSGEVLTAAYFASWDAEGTAPAAPDAPAAPSLSAAAPHAFTREESRAALARAIEVNRAAEAAAHRTKVGPNHDGIEFAIDGRDAGTFASQGQQRSLVLAWKLAEAELIEEMLGTLPVLLLDDVMSELDGRRREALVRYLAHGAQTFITTANIDYFDSDMLSRADIIRLPLESTAQTG